MSTQELNDQIKALSTRITVKAELDGEAIHERLRKSYETCTQRIKTAELYVTDKHNDTKELIKTLEVRQFAMATKD